MDTIEERGRKRKKKADLQRLILQVVATSGILAVALVAPNVIGALAKTGILPDKRRKETINRSLQRCLKIKLLKKDGNELVLTPKGERLLSVVTFKDIVRRAGSWDGRWRVLIFDIPENRKHVRERVREFLRSIGFSHLQDSVWIIPYDCEDIVTLLKREYYLKEDMKYMVVESIEDDEKLRKQFKLN